MPDAVYENLLKWSGDDKALKAFIEEFEALKKQTAELQDKFAQLSKQHEKHAETVHELEHEHRLLHTAMHKVTEESPIMGTLLRSALSPDVAPLIAVTVALGLVHKALKANEEQAKKTAEEQEKAAHEAETALGESVNKMREYSAQAKEAVSDLETSYTNWVKKLVEEGPKAEAQLERELSKLHSMVETFQKLAELQGQTRPEAKVKEAETLAELDLTRKAHDDTRKELAAADKRANEALAQAEKGAASTEAKRIKDDEAETIKRLAATKEQIRHEQETIEKAKSGRPEDIGAARAAEFRVLPQLRQAQAREEQNIAESEKKIAALAEARKKERDELDKAKAAADKLAETYKTQEKKISDLENKAKDLGLTRLQQDALDYQKAVKELDKAIKEAAIGGKGEHLIHEDEAVRKAQAAVDAFGKRGPQLGFESMFVPGVNAAALRAQRQPLTPEQQNQDQALIDFLQSIKAFNPTLMRLLIQHADDTEWMKAEMEVLLRRAKDIKYTLPGQ